ncbi:hypothetical protein SGHV022 [Glossina pallidipes salivary gland hypertrophy virus]|uniref:Uncharacterized protein n=1 Tax=Glossina hytrovirus (isolate Glossina pallidipes/Ethiopia/Seibersdorf/-) TaxID=379529 RepID=B0YLH6_GHVS|nr:hypothetical protein SGHV022 [Glossina pallidipes salivary gland hypertrophy virus]ABQ08795.1 hypothetical protein SGHV022 [Glossina pallidipes salivary gland hypertrophy virus]
MDQFSSVDDLYSFTTTFENPIAYARGIMFRKLRYLIDYYACSVYSAGSNNDTTSVSDILQVYGWIDVLKEYRSFILNAMNHYKNNNCMMKVFLIEDINVAINIQSLNERLNESCTKLEYQIEHISNIDIIFNKLVNISWCFDIHIKTNDIQIDGKYIPILYEMMPESICFEQLDGISMRYIIKDANGNNFLQKIMASLATNNLDNCYLFEDDMMAINEITMTFLINNLENKKCTYITLYNYWSPYINLFLKNNYNFPENVHSLWERYILPQYNDCILNLYKIFRSECNNYLLITKCENAITKKLSKFKTLTHSDISTIINCSKHPQLKYLDFLAFFMTQTIVD